MNWEDKFDVVINCLDDREDIDADFYLANCSATETEVRFAKLAYPAISNDYINFLKLYNGADIAQCRIFGTSQLKEAENIYSDVYPTSEWFAFGTDAGGNPLMQNRQGQIFLGFGKSSEPEYHFLANNFSNFIDEVLMGKNYPKIFWLKIDEFKEFIEQEIGEDPWLDFLIEKKWLTV